MDSEQPLLPQLRTVRGAVDHHGLPAQIATTGGWNSALFIIGMELAQMFAFFGVSANLIMYLTGMLGQSTATAAANVNAWSGAVSLLPLLGGVLADSWLGRYMTIIWSSLLLVLGLVLVTFSAVSPALRPNCGLDGQCTASEFQVAFFFSSIYLVALAHGGRRPCTLAFGADQFNEDDPRECEQKSSFFNWWNFWSCLCIVVAIITVTYIQDNISWGLGFGISCIPAMLALFVFLLGRKTYRYLIYPPRTIRGWMGSTSEGECLSEQAKVTSSRLKEGNYIAALSKLLPIWATSLVFGLLEAQHTTFFTKQGNTMDLHITPSFQVPPASLINILVVTFLVCIPIYDRIFVPLMRSLTGLSSGITKLQRIGIGIVLSMLTMVVAALVEMKRLEVAMDSGAVESTIPMRVWWLVPQYVLGGITDVFIIVGLQEFFYDQVPNALRSLGVALFFSIFGIGNFISGFLVTVIDNVSRKSGGSWFADDLNHGHLDYFYWLLAGLSAIQLLVYLFFSRLYVYRENASLNGTASKVLE